MFDFILKWDTVYQIISFVVLLGVGVFFLVKFCDIFVDSASCIAKKLKISPLIIGLTIVAMGTSCPELAVSVSDSLSTLKLIQSGVDANANVALGNVVGSNICNIVLVLGLSALFTPMIVRKSIIKKELPILLGISTLLVIFGCFFNLGDKLAIVRWEAIIFVVLIVAYLVYVVLSAKKDNNGENETQGEEIVIKEMSIWKAIILCIVGIAGIIIGGEMVVFGAKGLATEGALAIGLDADLTEALVGLTIVAVGTSLPELVTSVIAAKKGENELAIGNVVGSNIFNILFILGIAG
ncbi:MAG: calcium/sodium antiporter, partial [Clostridia bacterium]|nr:calcium/sodium antiporter [Clostridia bacterium]